MKVSAKLLFLLACLPVGASIAADFDGSKRLICAAAEARDCISGEQCGKGLPADFALPTFMRVDIAAKTVTGPMRTTEIRLLEKTDGQVLMQGSEFGHAWSLALNTIDGTMTGSITDRGGVYVLFGACTPL